MKTIISIIVIAIVAYFGYKVAQDFDIKNFRWQSSKLRKEAAASGQCFYNGKIYNRGERFTAIDECNLCTCENNPLDPDQPIVSCTERACS